MNGLARKLDRWSAVLRYHRPEQLARRLWNRVREKLPIADASVEGSTPEWRLARESSFAPRTFVRSRSERRHSIRLLNRDYSLGWPPRWDDAEREGLPLLTAFHLHYHEHLLDRIDDDPDSVWQTIESWIVRFPLPDRTTAGWTAWHPYCISRRMFVWIRLFESSPGIALQSAMIDHLAKQARRLASRFERDIGGNHLWENARALAAAGSIFAGEEADDWREQGLSTLWQCFAEQLSPEGEHYERAPMYQGDLAHGLLELAEVLQRVDKAAAERCRGNARRMTDFLDAIRPPDGGLPLFGDTTLDGDHRLNGARSASKGDCTSPVQPLLALRAPNIQMSSWHGDYFIHRDERSFLLFDAGDIGPDDLPAHAHADLLGFEASAFGKRLFVDSGVYTYAGPRREEFRRSAAHNVLTVDGVELADVWGSFRVGRRGHVVAKSSGRENGFHWCMAEHDAYRRMGVRVQRWWIIADEGVWISIHVVLGNGSRTLAERLHLHPEIHWTRNAESVRLQMGSGDATWRPLADSFTSESTAYSERFNEDRLKTTFVIERSFDLPAMSAWGLVFGGGELQASAAIDGDRLIVRWTHDGAERRFESHV